MTLAKATDGEASCVWMSRLSLYQVRDHFAEHRMELEALSRITTAEHDVPDPVDHKMAVRGIGPGAHLRTDQGGVKTRKVCADALQRLLFPSWIGRSIIGSGIELAQRVIQPDLVANARCREGIETECAGVL